MPHRERYHSVLTFSFGLSIRHGGGSGGVVWTGLHGDRAPAIAVISVAELNEREGAEFVVPDDPGQTTGPKPSEAGSNVRIV